MKELSREEMKNVIGGSRGGAECRCYSNTEPRPPAYCFGNPGDPEPACPENYEYFCPCPL
jgi:bacteriocin-like protein